MKKVGSPFVLVNAGVDRRFRTIQRSQRICQPEPDAEAEQVSGRNTGGQWEEKDNFAHRLGERHVKSCCGTYIL
eukprot:s1257_g15.t1